MRGDASTPGARSPRLTAILAACLVAAIAAPVQGGAHDTRPGRAALDAGREACFAIQQDLGRALRSLNLDESKSRKDVGSPEFFDLLVSRGLVPEKPVDPGFGPGSFTHYRYRKAGNGITCFYHGDPDTTSPSERNACFVVQRTLADAILDYRRDEGPVRPGEIGSKEFFHSLVSRGYLEAFPVDPGHDWRSFDHFVGSRSGGVECTVHGPAYQKGVSSTALCWQVQREIALALERYSVAHNVVRTDVGNLAFFRQLVAEGLLKWIPEDPGQGPDSYGNYRWVLEGNNVECAIHGQSGAPTSRAAAAPATSR